MRSPPSLGVCFLSGDWLLGRLYAFGATSSSPFSVSHRLFVSLLVCESSFYLDTRPRRLVASDVSSVLWVVLTLLVTSSRSCTVFSSDGVQSLCLCF